MSTMIKIPEQPKCKEYKSLGVLPHAIIVIAASIAVILANCAIADRAVHQVVDLCKVSCAAVGGMKGQCGGLDDH